MNMMCSLAQKSCTPATETRNVQLNICQSYRQRTIPAASSISRTAIIDLMLSTTEGYNVITVVITAM